MVEDERGPWSVDKAHMIVTLASQWLDGIHGRAASFILIGLFFFILWYSGLSKHYLSFDTHMRKMINNIPETCRCYIIPKKVSFYTQYHSSMNNHFVLLSLYIFNIITKLLSCIYKYYKTTNSSYTLTSKNFII